MIITKSACKDTTEDDVRGFILDCIDMNEMVILRLKNKKGFAILVDIKYIICGEVDGVARIQNSMLIDWESGHYTSDDMHLAHELFVTTELAIMSVLINGNRRK